MRQQSSAGRRCYKAAMDGAVWRRCAGRLPKAVAALVFVWLVLMVAGRVIVWRDRRTAERMFGELTTVQVGERASVAMEGLRARWGTRVEALPSCSAEVCDYDLQVYFLNGRWALRTLLVELARGQEVWTMLLVTVRGGVVARLDYSLLTGVPKGYGTRWERSVKEPPGYVWYASEEYGVVAHAIVTSTFDDYVVAPATHPDYDVRAPSGCTGCVGIFSEVKSAAPGPVRERMLHIDFSCMTRWRACADELDIMPEAGAVLYRERRDRFVGMG